MPTVGWKHGSPAPAGPSSIRRPYAARNAPNPLLQRAAFYLDAAQTFWQEWVVNYDLNHQIIIAERLQESTQQVGANWNPNFHFWRKQYLPYVLAPLALIPLFFLLRSILRALKLRTGRATHAEVSALYRRMLRILQSRGFTKPASLTAGEFASSLPPSPLAAAVAEFTECYQAFRYGNDTSRLHELAPLLDRMKAL